MHLYSKKVIFLVHFSQQPHIRFKFCKKQIKSKIVIFVLNKNKLSLTILFLIYHGFKKQYVSQRS